MGRPRSTAAGGAAPALSATPCAAHCSCRSRPQPLWPRKTPTTCRSGSAAAGGAAPSSRACLQTRLPTWRRAARPTCRRALLRRILLHRSAVPGSAPRCGWLRCRRRCGALRVARAAEVSARRPSPACSRCCATQVWAKVLPLGLIFFVASFNLTILQASLPHACGPCVHAAGRGRRGAAAASAGAAVLLSSPACPPSCMRRFHHPCPAEPPARHHGDRPLLHPRIQLSHCWPPLAPCPAEPQGRHHGDDGGRGDAALPGLLRRAARLPRLLHALRPHGGGAAVGAPVPGSRLLAGRRVGGLAGASRPRGGGAARSQGCAVSLRPALCRSTCFTRRCPPWSPFTRCSPRCSTPCTPACTSTASTPPPRHWCPRACTACSRVRRRRCAVPLLSFAVRCVLGCTSVCTACSRVRRRCAALLQHRSHASALLCCSAAPRCVCLAAAGPLRSERRAPAQPPCAPCRPPTDARRSHRVLDLLPLLLRQRAVGLRRHLSALLVPGQRGLHRDRGQGGRPGSGQPWAGSRGDQGQPRRALQ